MAEWLLQKLKPVKELTRSQSSRAWAAVSPLWLMQPARKSRSVRRHWASAGAPSCREFIILRMRSAWAKLRPATWWQILVTSSWKTHTSWVRPRIASREGCTKSQSRMPAWRLRSRST